MSTRKIKDAVDLSTGEKVYYKSHAKATYMSDGRTVEDAIKTAGGGGGMAVIDHGTEDTTFTLTPNKFHVWGEVDSLTLSFGEEQSGVMNEYLFQFSSGTNATALSLPEGVEWENGAYPELLANATHQVSIVNGLASIAHYYTRKYLTIEVLEDGLTFAFPKELEYRVNEGKWKTLSANTASPSFVSGDKIQLRAELVPGTTSTTYGIGTFTISKSCNLSGNCMSLLFRDNAAQSNLAGYDFAFYKLFSGCTTIKSVSDDFLTSPIVTQYCYSAMYRGCTGLSSSSALPALTLAKGSYDYMYDGCSNLKYIKMLATDISAEGCLTNWVSGVASSGTFVKNKNATWSVTGANGIPSGWNVKTE